MYASTHTAQPRLTRFGSGGAFLRSKTPLTDEQIMQAAPSVFADVKHESRSERYTHIPTEAVLKGLRENGFFPYEVRQGGSRDEVKRGFTKHMMRFRRDVEVNVGEQVRELVLVNSHDGTSTYQLMSGIYRLVCSNGLVVPDGIAEMIKVPHKGDIVGQVIEGAFTVIDDAAAVDASIDSMKSIRLNNREQILFAESALTVKYGEDKQPINALEVLAPRRREDHSDDLWTVFNRVQENMIKGGVRYAQLNEQGRIVARRQTRPVNAVSGNVNLNKALWQLAAGFEQLKQAA